MSLLDGALLTVKEAQTYLKITSDAEIENLELIINGITGDFEVETRRRLKVQTITDYLLSGDGCDTIQLPYWPVVQVNSITVLNRDGTVNVVYENNSSPSSVSGEDFTTNPKSGRVRLYNASFPWGQDNIKVTFIAGFATNSVQMALLKQLALIQLDSDYKELRDGNAGVAMKQFQDSAITFVRKNDSGHILPSIAKALERFTRQLA